MTYPNWKQGGIYAEGKIVWDAGKLYRQIDRGPKGGGIVASIRPSVMAEQGQRWEVYDPNATSYHPWEYGKSYANGDWVIFDGHYYRQRDDYGHSDTRSVFKPNAKSSNIRWANMGLVGDYATPDPRPTEHRVEALEETVAAQGQRIGKLEMRPHPWEAPPAYGRSPSDVFLDLRDANLQIDALAAENKRLRFSLEASYGISTKPGAINRLEKCCVSLHAEVKLLREKNRVQFNKLQAATKALRG